MSIIVPTVTAFDSHTYRQQMECAVGFAKRIHIDLMDGIFAPTTSPDLSSIWLPEGVECDIHIMYQHPEKQLQKLIRLRPSMVIVHAEAQCDVDQFAQELSKHNIKTGIALLQDTSVEEAKDKVRACSHCLIFSGHLGYHGGVADLSQLRKVEDIKTISNSIEISWDGGVSIDNAPTLALGGVDVLNVGGAIQKQEDPRKAYELLVKSLEK